MRLHPGTTWENVRELSRPGRGRTATAADTEGT
jgi:hypothetical protein